MRQVFDPIRKLWVVATPEEMVRQQWIRAMIERLGYPPGLLAVEKELTSLPHLQGLAVPERRLDILCFAPRLHPDHALFPLLLIECKSGPLTEAALRQVLGYNAHVQASYTAVVNAECALVSSPSGQLSSLPRYDAIVP